MTKKPLLLSTIAFLFVISAIAQEKITDLSNIQEYIIRQAINTAKAYQKSSLNSPVDKEHSLDRGAKLFSYGAADVESYNKNFYRWSWRGEECYYSKKDFRELTYTGADNLYTDFVKRNTPLTYVSDAGSIITIFVLNKNGHVLHCDDEQLGVDCSADIVMMQIDDNAPLVLSSSSLTVDLIVPQITTSLTPGEMSDEGGVVFQQRLMSDGYLSVFYDGDYQTEVYSIPSQNALLMAGDLYRRKHLPVSDLPTFGLKGKVKTLKVNNTGSFWLNYSFDEQGHLTKVWSKNGDKYFISRQCSCLGKSPLTYGVTLTVDSEDAVTRDEYTLNLTTGRLVSIISSEGGDASTLECVYNDDGVITQYVSTYYSSDEDEDDQVVTIPVTNIATDKNGNWTKRRVGKTIETRVIEYY